MSLVFPQKLDLAAAVAQSALIVLARVDRLSNGDQFFHVRVERTLLGTAAVGSELEIRPAGWQLGQQCAESMANGGPSFSYSVPLLDGKAPVVKAGASYVFLLLENRELTAMNAWRLAKEADAISTLSAAAPRNAGRGPIGGQSGDPEPPS